MNRTAIEEELEVLYDAYYEDLEHYANLQQQHVAGGGPFPGSVVLDQNGAVIGVQGQQHPNIRHPPGRGKHHAPATNGITRKGQQPRSVPPPPPPQDDEEYEEEDGDEYDDDDEFDDEEEDEEGEDEDDGDEDESGSSITYNFDSFIEVSHCFPVAGKPGKRKGDMFSFSSNFTAAGGSHLYLNSDKYRSVLAQGQEIYSLLPMTSSRTTGKSFWK